ncbi:response regulator [bacterium]|nr:response regulator [bacterium]
MAHILIVDDETMARTGFRKILARAGYVTEEAADGEEALRILRRERVDLCVLDIIMPNKDGIEVLRELRETDNNLPVLAISGGGHADLGLYLRMAKKLGVSATLAKPFGADELLETVEGLLAKA